MSQGIRTPTQDLQTTFELLNESSRVLSEIDETLNQMERNLAQGSGRLTRNQSPTEHQERNQSTIQSSELRDQSPSLGEIFVETIGIREFCSRLDWCVRKIFNTIKFYLTCAFLHNEPSIQQTQEPTQQPETTEEGGLIYPPIPVQEVSEARRREIIWLRDPNQIQQLSIPEMALLLPDQRQYLTSQQWQEVRLYKLTRVRMLLEELDHWEPDFLFDSPQPGLLGVRQTMWTHILDEARLGLWDIFNLVERDEYARSQNGGESFTTVEEVGSLFSQNGHLSLYQTFINTSPHSELRQEVIQKITHIKRRLLGVVSY